MNHIKSITLIIFGAFLTHQIVSFLNNNRKPAFNFSIDQLTLLFARDLSLSTVHQSKLPLHSFCQSELVALLFSFRSFRSIVDKQQSNDFEQLIYNALNVKTNIDTVQMLLKYEKLSVEKQKQVSEFIDEMSTKNINHPIEINSNIDSNRFSREKTFSLNGNPSKKIEKFTIVIPTYYNGSRLPVLLETIETWHSYDEIDRVLICWNDVDTNLSPPSSPSFPNLSFDVVFEKPLRNSLNNRYKDSEHIRTDAVLMLDDDQRPTTLQMQFAFEQWKTSRNRLVGFTPRRFVVRGVDSFAAEWLKVDAGVATLKQREFDGTIADRSAHTALHYRFSGCPAQVTLHPFFVHRKYLKLYWSDAFESARDVVDAMTNGEDIAINMLVTVHSNAPPLIIGSSVAQVAGRSMREESARKGVSGSDTHYERRVWAARRIASALLADNPSAVPLRETLAVTALCATQLTQIDEKQMQTTAQNHSSTTKTLLGHWLHFQQENAQQTENSAFLRADLHFNQ